MTLLGYADKLSVRPGEEIRFMVSASAASYRADVIRLERAFTTPKPAGYAEPVVPSPVSGDYPGRLQAIHPGSYVLVPNDPALRLEGSFTLHAFVYATRPVRDRDQGIIARRSLEGAGFALLLDGAGAPTLVLGNEQGEEERITGEPVAPRQWYALAAAYDASAGRARLAWRRLARGWLPSDEGAVEAEVRPGALGGGEVPLLIGAARFAVDGQGKPSATGAFNGKIDAPSVWSRPLSAAEIAALHDRRMPDSPDGLVAAWDFARDFGTQHVHDRSPHALHGRVVNMPARAVTGANWDGREVSFRLAPDQYGAIHFHEDDVDDAGWDPDFAFAVPADLRPGVYAARLRAGAEVEHVPFYVRPAQGAATAPILFLAPTNTYLAYANERLYETQTDDIGSMTDAEIKIWPWEEVLMAHPELGSSIYDRHPDGSGICYSSRLRPVVTMRPDFIAWLTGCTRHFASDLYLIEWLEHAGLPYDVATDEDLHLEGRALLDAYRVVLTGSHPEYWTTPMMDALEGYLGGGGKLLYLGGNGFYWVTAIDPARPHLLEVRRGHAGTRSWESAPGETTMGLTGEQGGLWRYRGKAPNAVVGVGFASEGWGGAPGYRRLPASRDPRAAWIFAGVGDDEVIGDFGLVMGGAAGDEIDRVDPALGTPPETLRLATTEGRHSDHYQLVIEDATFMMPGLGGTKRPDVRADLTLLEMPNGGAVFSVGSINWNGSLPHNGFANNVARVTENVVRRFAGLEG